VSSDKAVDVAVRRGARIHPKIAALKAQAK
jgi:hypothetical protein